MSSPGDAHARPLLEVEGRWSASTARALCWAAQLLAAVASSGLVVAAWLEWLPPRFALIDISDLRSFITVMVGTELGPSAVLGLMISFVALLNHVFARCGRVELHDDRVVLWKTSRTNPRWAVVLRLADLAGYDDGSADYLKLRPKGCLPTSTRFKTLLFPLLLTIPTATEQDRVAVIDFLDRRGVLRLA